MTQRRFELPSDPLVQVVKMLTNYYNNQSKCWSHNINQWYRGTAVTSQHAHAGPARLPCAGPPLSSLALGLATQLKSSCMAMRG